MQGVSQYFAGLSTCEHCYCEELTSISPSLKESIVYKFPRVCFRDFFPFLCRGGGSRFRIVFSFYIHSKVGNHSSKRYL